jgi:hypothetical protein
VVFGHDVVETFEPWGLFEMLAFGLSRKESNADVMVS